jgi:hypothetical protein
LQSIENKHLKDSQGREKWRKKAIFRAQKSASGPLAA